MDDQDKEDIIIWVKAVQGQDGPGLEQCLQSTDYFMILLKVAYEDTERYSKIVKIAIKDGQDKEDIIIWVKFIEG